MRTTIWTGVLAIALIVAIGIAGTTANSSMVWADTPSQQAAEPPSKPRGLEATTTHGQVVLTWDDPEDDSITGYVILRRVRVNDTGGDFDVLVGDTGSAATGYTDTTVAAGLTYTYRIKAINEHGTSERSRWSHIDTPAAPAQEEEQASEPPDKPRGLEATATHDSVTLTWDDPQDDSITGYVILRRIPGVDPEGQFDEMVPNTGSAATTYTDDTVSAETRYTYRIKAINGYGTSERSRWYHINVPAAPGQEAQQATEPPAPPTGLSAEVVAHDSVTLTWDAPNDASVSGHVVLRLDFVQSDLATLAVDTGTTATSYTDDTVEPDTLYFYYAQAINARGESELSHYAVAHTPADPNPAPVEPPARPTGLESAAASDLVLLSWADPQDDSVTGYRILRADIVDGVQGEFAVLIEDTGTAETSYADDTVENGRVYVYRVLAIGPGGVSEPSREVRVRTTEPVPPPNRPRGLPSQSTPQPRQSVSEPSGDDFPDDGTTTGRLEVGGSVTGDIDRNGDQDAFAVELVQGRTYRFDLEGSETEQGTLADPRIVYIFLVLGPGDISLLVGSTDEDSGKGENSQLEFTLPSGTTYPTGTYYILVEEHGDNATGTYRLSMDQVAGSGFGRTMTVKGNLQPGGTLSGTLGVPTHYGTFSYYFALEDLEVGRYTVDFGTGGINSIHHFLTDRERTGHVTLEDTWIIVAQAHGRRSFTFDVRPGMEGTHYVLLSMRQGDTADYTATLEEAMPHLRVGRTGVVGEVPADNDGFALHMEFFSVDLEAGQKYQVDIKGKHSDDEECEDDGGNDEACTLDHTMLGNIQAPDGDYAGGDGNFDDSDDDIGGTILHVYGGGDDRGNTHFTFTADEDGTHFLKVGGRLLRTEDGSGFRAGTFRLSVREVR